MCLRGSSSDILFLALTLKLIAGFWILVYSPGAQGGPVCKICPLILTLDPYWGP